MTTAETPRGIDAAPQIGGHFVRVADTSPRASERQAPDSVDWRKSIVVVTDDPKLRQRIEGFLDHLQNSPFKYSVPLDGGGTYQFTGKDMIRAVGLYVDEYKRHPNSPHVRDIILPALKDGKLQIASHDKKFDGSGLTGCFTLMYGQENLPVQIQIGKDYLRTMELKGPDGRYHPVTIEGVILNELVHAAFRTKDEPSTNLVENQFLRSRGKPERQLDMASQEYRFNPKPDYTSVFDKPLPASAPAPKQ